MNFRPQDRVERTFGAGIGIVTRVYQDGGLWADFGKGEELFSQPEGTLILFQRPHNHELKPPEPMAAKPYDPIAKMTPLPDRIIHV